MAESADELRMSGISMRFRKCIARVVWVKSREFEIEALCRLLRSSGGGDHVAGVAGVRANVL